MSIEPRRVHLSHAKPGRCLHVQHHDMRRTHAELDVRGIGSDAVIVRALMVFAGLPLIAGGLGLTMVGIFAPIGMPMLILGLALVSTATSPRS